MSLVQVMRQQAITWTSVDQDLRRHMASLNRNELKSLLMMSWLLTKYGVYNAVKGFSRNK